MNELHTPRLTLRPPAAGDLADSYALWSNPDVVRFIGGKRSTLEESWHRLLRYAGLWALSGFGYWIVRDRNNGRFVGEVGFADFHRGLGTKFDTAMEAGWVIAPEYQRRGLAVEALNAALSWAKKLKPRHGVACMIEPENTRSISLAEGAGFFLYDTVEYRGSKVRLFFTDNA